MTSKDQAQVCFRVRASFQRLDRELVALNRRGEFFFFSAGSETFFDFFQVPRSPKDYIEASGIEDGSLRARVRAILAECVGYGLLEKTLEPSVPWIGKLSATFPELLRRGEERAREVAFF